MESHLTSLAKTVAQISVELKSIKSIEDVIYTLTKEVQDLKKINLGRSASSAANENPNGMQRISDLHRSCSDPNIMSSILKSNSSSKFRINETRADVTDKERIHYSFDKKFESDSEHLNNKKQDFQIEKEKFRTLAPSFSNPRKLKKLTK